MVHSKDHRIRVVVIGARGRMGGYFIQKFEQTGFCEVRGLSSPLPPQSVSSALPGAAVVLLCVPVDVMATVIGDSLVPYLDGKTVLVDIGSVKMKPVEIMRALYKGPVVGTHPLYGPRDSAPGECAHRTALVSPDGTPPESIELVEQLFRAIGDEVFHTTAERHDRAMAQFHNLNFLSTVAYFAALDQPEELEPFLLPSFLRRVEAARVSLVDDAEMFRRLVKQNPMTGNVMKRYMEALVAAADEQELPELIARAQHWFDK